MARRPGSRHARCMTTHQTHPASPRRLTRSTSDKKLGGVAGGLAEHLSLDPTVVRVVFACRPCSAAPASSPTSCSGRSSRPMPTVAASLETRPATA